jgi:hypothetical protein
VLFLISTISFSQIKKERVIYGDSKINIPENYIRVDHNHVEDSLGFSVKWFKTPNNSDSFRKKTIKDMLAQTKYRNQTEVEFYSQNQLFKGIKVDFNDNKIIYVGFGTLNNQHLMIMIEFKREIKSNDDLKDFEKNFIKLL